MGSQHAKAQGILGLAPTWRFMGTHNLQLFSLLIRRLGALQLDIEFRSALILQVEGNI